MNKLSVGFTTICLAFASLAYAADDGKAPMPQTRGMQGMDPKFHDPANKPTITCTPKPGTEGMAHAPKDHPMPDTRGMKGMDPKQHMQDCVSSDEAAPVTPPIHQHKTPGQG
jgi:hypothetical protein